MFSGFSETASMLSSFRMTFPSSALLSASGQLRVLVPIVLVTPKHVSFFSSSPHFSRVFGNVRALEELFVSHELISLHSVIPSPGLRTLN